MYCCYHVYLDTFLLRIVLIHIHVHVYVYMVFFIRFSSVITTEQCSMPPFASPHGTQRKYEVSRVKLFNAAENGNLEGVKAQLTAGINVNAKNEVNINE